MKDCQLGGRCVILKSAYPLNLGDLATYRLIWIAWQGHISRSACCLIVGKLWIQPLRWDDDCDSKHPGVEDWSRFIAVIYLLTD